MPRDTVRSSNASTDQHVNAPAAANSITESKKEVFPTGTPSGACTLLRMIERPLIQVTIPSARGTRSTAQSKLCVSPSLRLAVSHAVPFR
jgi:hypothetical protein